MLASYLTLPLSNVFSPRQQTMPYLFDPTLSIAVWRSVSGASAVPDGDAAAGLCRTYTTLSAFWGVSTSSTFTDSGANISYVPSRYG